MAHRPGVYALFVCLAFASDAQEVVSADSSRVERELKQADSALLEGLLISLKDHQSVQADLSLALIGARSDSISRRYLARTIRFQVDGSLGVDMDCYLLNSGVPMIAELEMQDVDALRQSCLGEAATLLKEPRYLDAGVQPGTICAPVNEMKFRIANAIDGIKKNILCYDGDW